LGRETAKEERMVRIYLLLTGLVLCVISNAAADDLCGATILEDLKLDHDITCTGNGLIVGADGIKLNLQGHTIAGSGIGTGINVTGRRDVSIFGGTIRNFLAGVLVRESIDVVIKDNELIANGDGVDLQANAVANTVKGNRFRDNLTRGIMSRSFSSANTIKDNTFTGDRVGILLFGARNSTVKDNTLSFSILAGIRINVIAGDNLVQENTVTASPIGIDFLITPTGSSTGNTLRENTIALNTCGLKGPTSGNTLTDNVFDANASDTCS
jgi:parallel beta-helix repeat protein